MRVFLCPSQASSASAPASLCRQSGASIAVGLETKSRDASRNGRASGCQTSNGDACAASSAARAVIYASA